MLETQQNCMKIGLNFCSPIPASWFWGPQPTVGLEIYSSQLWDMKKLWRNLHILTEEVKTGEYMSSVEFFIWLMQDKTILSLHGLHHKYNPCTYLLLCSHTITKTQIYIKKCTSRVSKQRTIDIKLFCWAAAWAGQDNTCSNIFSFFWMKKGENSFCHIMKTGPEMQTGSGNSLLKGKKKIYYTHGGTQQNTEAGNKRWYWAPREELTKDNGKTLRWEYMKKQGTGGAVKHRWDSWGNHRRMSTGRQDTGTSNKTQTKPETILLFRQYKLLPHCLLTG